MPRASASKKTALASEQDRPDVARKRLRWKAHQGGVDIRRLVFIDESEPLKAPLVQAQWRTAKTNMTPLRGWAARGKRLIGKAPFGHWNTMTFIAALRHDAITAPWVIDGPINGGIFRTYVEEVLAPTLRKGDILRRENDPPDRFLILLSPRQPRQPQGPRHPQCHQGRRRKIALPPRLFARPQPDRTGLRQAQTPAAQRRRAQQRGRLAQDRLPPRSVQPQGMRKLPQKLRLWFRLNPSRSRSRVSMWRT